MQNFALIRMFWRSDRRLPPTTGRQSQAGFTLIELLVVVIMIGVLAAIAAPGWLGFVQQRRASAANDAVRNALEEAQSLARTRKLSYSVSFRNNNGIPEVAIYQKSASPDNYWKELGEQLRLKPNQIVIRTNIKAENEADATIAKENTPFKTISFNFLGSLPTGAKLDANDDDNVEGLVIEVAAPKDTTSGTPIPITRRCVRVRTLLGSLQTGKRNECDL